MKKLFLFLSLTVFLILCAGNIAHATNGYFSHGYGLKAKGMAGATTAVPQDSMVAASNPAGMAFVGDRFDIGLDWFSPKRDAERTGAGAASNINGSAESDSNNFFIPEFGYNRMLNPDTSIGITVYANGGMNTNYPNGQITSASGVGTCNNFLTMGGQNTATSHNLLCGTSRLGVDLMQLVIAPTVAYKITPNHSFGISPLIGYQRFKAEGLQGFAAYSEDRNNLTNNGYDTASGMGLRVGWMGKITDMVTLGAAYSTKIYMTRFEKYKGLFSEGGDFDMPENYNAGIAVRPVKPLIVAVDYQRINYSGVQSVGNSSKNGGSTIANTLGGDNDRGFGWENIDVWKLGLSYQVTDMLTLRGGYSHSDNPIQSQDVTFNILAPGVIKDHYTAGVSFKVSKSSELTLSYMHAKNNSVTGSSLFNDFGVAAGNEKIKMHQNSLGLAFGMAF
ncbi:MAG: long-chain fatty acid transport protein [Nitrospirae bacterium]|nr:MAG: long-chain fatty acid transport protein [Nitrospirota bacterium]